METFVRFGDVALNVSDRRFEYDDRTEACFAVARAFLADTFQNVTYHRQRWERVGVTPDQIKSFADLRFLPMMGPEDAQGTPEASLLPDKYKARMGTAAGLLDFPLEERLWRRFTSTGSTGKPKASYFTVADWDVALATQYRNFLGVPVEKWSRTFNCFNSGHVAGKTCEDTLGRYGLFVEARHFLAMMDEQALGQMYRGATEFGGFNAIAVPPCLPPQMNLKKGVTLDDLLKIDADNYVGKNIRTIFTGGFPSDLPEMRLRERVWEANDLAGAPHTHFIDGYGCAEVFTNIGTGCEIDHGLHVNRGHIIVEVTDEKTGQHVKGGERGFVCITGLKHGSRYVRYVVGDEATYLDEPCKCGRATPRIKDIRRVLDKGRIKSGCAAGGIG